MPRFRRYRRPLALVASLLLVLGAALVAILWITTPLPAPDHLRARAALGNTRILDRQGTLLAELPDPFTGRHAPVPIDDIPLALREATVAVEDRGFYRNRGVDPRGILRALLINLRAGEIRAGGSTITQQLARNFLLDPGAAGRRTLDRKLRETVLALKLTAAYSKDEILALYLNQSYYGGLSYGVEAAARRVFGKPVRDLDLAESALLAGLPQAPSRLDPLADLNAAHARQAEVLDAMVAAGSISRMEAAAAKAEPLVLAGASGGHPAVRAPHFVNYVVDQLAAVYGADAVTRGGLIVTTTLDADLNDTAEAIMRGQLRRLAEPGDGGPDRNVRNAAAIVLDPTDGAILAMAGSPDYHDATIQGQVNAALAPRQPGSAIKPLTYAAALERGWTAATEILDVPASFRTAEGPPYTPENYDRAFHGPLSLRAALATSSNVAAVRTLHAIGVDALLEMAGRLGITTLDRRGSYGLSLTLGGGEVTPLELTAAYAAFANGGNRVTPYAIVEVGKWSGEQASPSGTPGPEGLQPRQGARGLAPSPALTPQVAYIIADILADHYARMPAFGPMSPLDLDRPAAAKTGTTSDWRDNWTVGFTPDRVAGVWVGNADGESMEAISGITGAGPIWHDVMVAAHRGLPVRAFERPAGVVERTVCADSGLLPSALCPATRLERFVAGTEPTRADDLHVRLLVDPLHGCRLPAGAAGGVERVVRLLPAEAEPWAASAGLPRLPRPCAEELAGGAASEPSGPLPFSVRRAQDMAAPRAWLLTPAPGAIFAISPGVPADRQRIVLEATAGPDAARVTILVDGAPVATFTAPPYRALWPLEPGAHTAAVETEDRSGRLTRGLDITFVVEDEP